MMTMKDTPARDSDVLSQYVLNGDEKAFSVIVKRYGGLVRNACTKCLFAYNLLVEDAVQTVFMVLARRAGSIGPAVELPAWLHRVSVNVCRNILRSELSRNRREKADSEETAAIHVMAPTEEAEPQASMAWHLHECIDKLSEKDRKVIVLHYFNNQSCQLIAQTTGVSEDAAKMRLSRAREKLRQALEDRGATLSVVALVAVLDAECAAAMSAEVPAIRTGHADGSHVQDTADAVMTEMDREATVATWGKMGAVAAGLATIGVGTALVVSHLQTSTVAVTSWRIESVTGAAMARRGETVRTLKSRDSLCVGDTIMTSSNQETVVVTDDGDRILVREESELGMRNSERGTVEEGRARASSPRRGTADVRFLLTRGAVAAKVKRPAQFATPHAELTTGEADFFLMVASGVTTNATPWSFTRLDVTEGSAKLLPSSNLTSETPLVARQVVCAGTDHEGRTIQAMVRQSDGIESSPKYGGVLYRSAVELYDAGGYVLKDGSDFHVVTNVFCSSDTLRNRTMTVGTNGTLDVQGGTLQVTVRQGGPMVLVPLTPQTNGIWRISYRLNVPQIAQIGTAEFSKSVRAIGTNLRNFPRIEGPTPLSRRGVWLQIEQTMVQVGSTVTGLPVMEWEERVDRNFVSRSLDVWDFEGPAGPGLLVKRGTIELADVAMQKLERTK